MKKFIFMLPVFLCLKSSAQKNTVNHIIEGGRVVADILRVFKTPKAAMVSPSGSTPAIPAADSCAIKALGDFCYKNISGKSLYINLYKRNGNTYATIPMSLAILNNSKECLYEIQSGIYKYRIEYENEEEKRVVYKEGEFKIEACEKKLEEIKKE